MGVDDMKGRAKEAAGDLTGDEDVKREGKVDQLADKAKHVVDEAKEKLSGLVNRDKK